MKQIIVNEFGSPEMLILHDVPMPTAGDGQIGLKYQLQISKEQRLFMLQC